MRKRRLFLIKSPVYRRITSVTDKASGKEIPEEDMLLNRWYTVTVYAYTEKSGALYVYFNPYSEDSIACEGYITGEKFVPLKGLTAVSFVKNSDSQCALKQTIENGEMVVSYFSNGSAWDSRIQFTEKMLGCYNDNFVNGSNPKLKFSICFTGEDKDIQFWSIVSAGYGNCPTLGGLLIKSITYVLLSVYNLYMCIKGFVIWKKIAGKDNGKEINVEG